MPGIEGASAGNGREYCGSAGGTVVKSVQGNEYYIGGEKTPTLVVVCICWYSVTREPIEDQSTYNVTHYHGFFAVAWPRFTLLSSW